MAGRRAGTTERTFQSMNRKVEEMTKRWCGGWNGGKASSTDAMTMTTVRFRASRSGSTNYELKIDEPLSVSSRAQPDRTGKGRGGGRARVGKGANSRRIALIWTRNLAGAISPRLFLQLATQRASVLIYHIL